MKIFWVMGFCLLTTTLQAEFTNLPTIPAEYHGTFYMHEQITDGKVERPGAAKRFGQITAKQVGLDRGEKLKVTGVSLSDDPSLLEVSFANREFWWAIVRVGSQFHITQYQRGTDGSLHAPAIFFVSQSQTPPVPMRSYSPAQIREIFFLLGMNNEYMGKRAGRPNMFYKSEGAKQALCDQHFERLRKELGLKPAEQAGLVVDSFYKRGGASYSIGGVIYTISEDAFEGFGEEAALGYLAGAAARDWHEDGFSLANAGAKADVIANLLARHGCTEVRVCRNYGLVPTGYEVQCKPSPAIQKLIEEAVAERERNELPAPEKTDSTPEPVRKSP
ncbi:MAG: hypothetical protein PCFJNLEI_02932 [Verrucomicrobiae bacterium]|nr:hypothetical protein [Verrucomicrobiae bacterium]